MRFGAPVFGDCATPEAWVSAIRGRGYRAAYCPIGGDSDSATRRAYEAAATSADIVIAEVGAWSNPMSRDPDERIRAIQYCKTQLRLADDIGARCCVNISGSLGPRWDGPDPENLTADTFDAVVETTREIIDSVAPLRTSYALEPMPWMVPDSVDSYLRLLAAVDRPRFGVHLDPVNMISSPQRYLASGAFLRDCFDRLGHRILAIHAKDVVLADNLTVHIDEVRPGLGTLDYKLFLQLASQLDSDTPLLLEHLPGVAEYDLAAQFVRSVAAANNIAL